MAALDQRPSPRRGYSLGDGRGGRRPGPCARRKSIVTRLHRRPRPTPLPPVCNDGPPRPRAPRAVRSGRRAKERGKHRLVRGVRRAHCGPSLRVAVYQEVPVGSSGVYEAILEQATDAERVGQGPRRRGHLHAGQGQAFLGVGASCWQSETCFQVHRGSCRSSPAPSSPTIGRKCWCRPTDGPSPS